VTKAAKEANERWSKLKASEDERPPLKEYVAAARSIAKEMVDLWEQAKNYFGLVVMDECHHLTADDWRKAVLSINARYRVGLSATAFPELAKEQSRGVIWLKASCGPVRIRVDPEKLTEQGYLTPGRVVIQKVLQPDRNDQGWSQQLRDECILLNPHRNGMIIHYAERYASEGCRVLITSNRHSQVAALLLVAARKWVPCEYLIGSASVKHGLAAGTTKERSRKVAGLIARKPPILVGTVLSEGVDIPEVDVVINAEGGRDVKATIQRMRNLTVSEGKTEAIFVDFMDMTNAYFRKHSKARLKVYKNYGGLKVEQVD
jgi:superfamily II DNA or RNA helicase